MVMTDSELKEKAKDLTNVASMMYDLYYSASGKVNQQIWSIFEHHMMGMLSKNFSQDEIMQFRKGFLEGVAGIMALSKRPMVDER